MPKATLTWSDLQDAIAYYHPYRPYNPEIVPIKPQPPPVVEDRDWGAYFDEPTHQPYRLKPVSATELLADDILKLPTLAVNRSAGESNLTASQSGRLLASNLTATLQSCQPFLVSTGDKDLLPDGWMRLELRISQVNQAVQQSIPINLFCQKGQLRKANVDQQIQGNQYVDMGGNPVSLSLFSESLNKETGLYRAVRTEKRYDEQLKRHRYFQKRSKILLDQLGQPRGFLSNQTAPQLVKVQYTQANLLYDVLQWKLSSNLRVEAVSQDYTTLTLNFTTEVSSQHRLITLPDGDSIWLRLHKKACRLYYQHGTMTQQIFPRSWFPASWLHYWPLDQDNITLAFRELPVNQGLKLELKLTINSLANLTSLVNQRASLIVSTCLYLNKLGLKLNL